MIKENLKPLRNNCKQLALVVLGFVVCISLLEAKGFVVWAKRLEASTTQQMALKTMEGLESAWSVFARPVVNFRPQALAFLTQHGWSDMPAAVSVSGHEPTESFNPYVDGESLFNVPATEPGASTPQAVPQTEGDAGGASSGVRESNPGNQGSEQTNEGLPTTQDAQAHQGDNTQSTTPPSTRLKNPFAQLGVDGQLVPLPALQAEESRHIVLAGDSMMAVGLAPQLQRELVPFKSTSSTAKAYRAATGLARPDVFNWQKEYPRMIGAKKPDVVIVAIGGNDTQNLDVNRKVLVIGTDEWNAVYEERLTNYLNMLTQDGAVVLWIKLPPMRPTKYNNNVNSVNAIAQKVVAANPNAIWWDVSDRFVNEQGKFQEFGIVPSGTKPVRIRQTDGIHLTDQGAKLISGDILKWLNLAAPFVEPVTTPVDSEGQLPVVVESVVSSSDSPDSP